MTYDTVVTGAGMLPPPFVAPVIVMPIESADIDECRVSQIFYTRTELSGPVKQAI